MSWNCSITSSKLVKTWLRTWKWEAPPQLPYSPYTGLWDYLCQSMELDLCDQYFQSYWEIKNRTDLCIPSKDDKYFRSGSRTLPKSGRNVVSNNQNGFTNSGKYCSYIQIFNVLTGHRSQVVNIIDYWLHNTCDYSPTRLGQHHIDVFHLPISQHVSLQTVQNKSSDFYTYCSAYVHCRCRKSRTPATGGLLEIMEGAPDFTGSSDIFIPTCWEVHISCSITSLTKWVL